ncbi:uncharacterized protein LOC123690164 [Pieris rapae]|uniref:uncharacterized protein LOC123690164 n=1 Tax=Pieris rapae TaxID=64459 RepID=UPI001E27CA31|nr:uncharacterized protein LOC123690164 [Pieris rapae]
MFNVFGINIHEMDFLSLACFYLNIIALTNGYVLFAANIDDFQTIAKKLGSPKVIDELKQIANDPEIQKYFAKPRAKSQQYNADQNFPVARQREPTLSLKETGTKIDFEELVERVRQRLEKEFQSKSNNKRENFNRPTKQIIEHVRGKTKTTKRKPYDEKDTQENVEPSYADPINYDTIKETSRNVPETHDFDLPFKKIDMLKDDSYEDYKTPAKDTYVFSNEHPKENRFKIKNNKIEVRPTLEIKRLKHKTKTTEDYAEIVGSNEIKARTEKLEYEDDNRSEKVGTGIPTRETYKMVTPNYYGNLPTVAERYDFNEPIPERDRQRENIKHFVNPPARINKKIRLL